jgi:two-component system OmpR family sensor kinase
MSESEATKANEKPAVTRPLSPWPEHPSVANGIVSLPSHPTLVDPQEESQPFLSSRRSTESTPSWFRPFSSMHIQLTFVFCLILIIAVLLVVVLVFQQPNFTVVTITAIITIIVSTGIGFIFIGILLRPLMQVTDAAQAIAIGDLQQRDRLPLRLPPQDEVDRLAGSLNEMVTRLEHAQQLQHAAERRFQRFFSDASHQLRTPLTSIRGFTEVLMRGAKDDPETAMRVLKRMKSEAERMTSLLNDILTLARLDDGQQLKTQYIDLKELALEGIEQARKQTKDDRQVSLVSLQHVPIGIQADRERIKQLIFILLDNAIKHGRPAPNGVITLRLDKQNGQAIICVIDNGEGIASQDLAHIFDSFYRGQHYQSSTVNGTPAIGAGLGLTIASAIVRVHQGTISASSLPDEGTEFKVTFPSES